jgi:hypothetical protein
MCTRSSSKVAAAAAVVCVIALAACNRERISPEEQAAHATVRRYNDTLVQAFRTGRAELLAEVAEPEEVMRVGTIIGGLAERGEVMEARQTELRIIGTTVNLREKAVTLVDVIEGWRYEHRRRAAPGTPVTPKTATYRLVYNLTHDDAGRFKVWQIVQHELPAGEASR